MRITEWLRFDDPVELLVAHRAAQPADDRMAAYRHVEGLHGWIPGLSNRRIVIALCG